MKDIEKVKVELSFADSGGMPEVDLQFDEQIDVPKDTALFEDD